MFTKDRFSSQGNPQKYKNPNNIIPYKVWDFCHRYSRDTA